MVGEQFVQITNKFLRDHSLSRQAKLVGALIATYCNADGLAWPGVTRLRADSGYGRHVIECARAELVKSGFLEKVYSARSADGKFPRGGVRFRVTAKILHEPRPRKGGTR
jgi:hypothetical protein